MNDVVFVMANSKLAKTKKARKTHEMEFDDISSNDDWVLDMNVEDGSTENLDEDFVLVNEDQNEKDEDEDVTIVHNLEEHVEGKNEYEGEDEFEDEDNEEGGNDDPLGDYDLLQHELFGNYH